MSSQAALAIDSLNGFEITADGQYLMLRSNQPDCIALHCSVMHELLAALANAIARSERIRQHHQSLKFAMPCEAWQVAGDVRSERHLVLSFRLPGGAELSFRMHRTQAAHMTEVLAMTTGLSQPRKPAGVRMQ